MAGGAGLHAYIDQHRAELDARGARTAPRARGAEARGDDGVDGGRPVPRWWFVSRIPSLEAAVSEALHAEDLWRSMILAPDAIGPQPPTDGGFYHQAGVPIVDFLAAPWYLFDEADTLDTHRPRQPRRPHPGRDPHRVVDGRPHGRVPAGRRRSRGPCRSSPDGRLHELSTPSPRVRGPSRRMLAERFRTAEPDRQGDPMSTTTRRGTAANGVDVASLFGTIGVVKGQRELAAVPLPRREPVGERHPQPHRRWAPSAAPAATTSTRPSYTFDADHPAVLVGADEGPAARGVPAARDRRLPHRRHRQHRRGPRRRAAIGDAPRSRATSTCRASSGCPTRSATATRPIRVHFEIDSPADPPTRSSAVVEQSTARSAVFDVLTNGTAVDVSSSTVTAARARRGAAPLSSSRASRHRATSSGLPGRPRSPRPRPEQSARCGVVVPPSPRPRTDRPRRPQPATPGPPTGPRTAPPARSSASASSRRPTAASAIVGGHRHHDLAELAGRRAVERVGRASSTTATAAAGSGAAAISVP